MTVGNVIFNIDGETVYDYARLIANDGKKIKTSLKTIKRKQAKYKTRSNQSKELPDLITEYNSMLERIKHNKDRLAEVDSFL